MNITIIGTGYVGLVSGTCFSELGLNVVCVDVNEKKIEDLKKGIIPIYEPGLERMVLRNVAADRLRFTTSLKDVLDDVDVVFIAVGTPPDEDGCADMRYVLDVAKTIGENINSYKLVVIKSTVPVGTSERVRESIQNKLDDRNINIEFDIASNPEFLKEGDAINDFMKPDRVVVGIDSERAKELMTKIYRPMMLNNFRVIFMDIHSAEMTKYASNAMLATRISFMNDIANLCELVGADVNMVRKGIGSDTRIGNKFLYPGTGYGGSCFPKDVKALIHTAEEYGYRMNVLKAVEDVNDRQKNILFEKFNKYYSGDIKGKKVAVWGLSFKPETDDIREAPALVLIKSLIDNGCEVYVYDPVAMNEAKKILGNSVKFAKDIYDCVLDTEAIFHVTEWKEFRLPNWEVIKRSMKPNPVLLDGRNVFDGTMLKGIEYIKIG
ncbi:MAG: UDP-glucose/GDP-mannose dehydrogenase family protein [Petrimonas sp.]|nr:UDP-glucose/GDP-mannose dehydrogenase family protein [Petrimonas sp.]MEA5080297.1 UDP-glucose/GDP-mannose dehydrogenase family protein [Dysgonamonadaceae bacterium]